MSRCRLAGWLADSSPSPLGQAQQFGGVQVENGSRVGRRQGLVDVVDEMLQLLRWQHWPVGAEHEAIGAKRLARAAQGGVLFVDRVEPEAPRQVARHQVRTLRLPPTLALRDVVHALQEERQGTAKVGD